MTIPSNGGNNPPISMSDINTDSADGFNLGNNLNGYKGQIYHQKSDGSVGLFPTGSISLSDFYGKRRVDAGIVNDTSAGSKNYTIPPYRTISFTIRAGSGQGGGGSGSSNDVNNCGAGGGTAGSPGTYSQLGSSNNSWYLYADGGGAGGGGSGYDGYGGTAGADGANASNYDTSVTNASYGPAGTGLGRNGMRGGYGGIGGKVTTITLTNPILGGSGPTSGSTTALVIGTCANAGGNGGVGGKMQQEWNGFSLQNVCRQYGYGSGGGGGGGSGVSGYMSASWT